MAKSFREYTNTRRGEAKALPASPDENVDYDALAKIQKPPLFVIPTRLCQGFGGEESCFYSQLEDPSLLVGMTSWAFCECFNYEGEAEKPCFAPTVESCFSELRR
jgi:hypothetical protein